MLNILKVDNNVVSLFKHFKVMTTIKKSWKRHTQQQKTYIIEYCIPPDYKTIHKVEKTGMYAYVRSNALNMASSGYCIIMDIKEK